MQMMTFWMKVECIGGIFRSRSGATAKTRFVATGRVELKPGYQKPHCFVATIQSPRARFVRAWAMTQAERLFVR